MMTPTEALQLQDILSTHLLHMTGVQKVLQNARDDSSDYAMCQMLSEAISNSIQKVMKAMPEEWRQDSLFIIARQTIE